MRYNEFRMIHGVNGMKKTIITAAVLLGAVLMGCTGKKYNVDYCGQKSLFSGARDSYPEGKEVTLKYGPIATDTDYSIYVDGHSMNYDYDEKKGKLVVTFTMPDHDIEVYCDSRNSMVNDYNPSYTEPEFTKEWTLLGDEEYTAPEGTVSMHAVSMGGYSPMHLNVTITNNSSETYSYGDAFTMQKMVNGTYEDIPGADEIMWTMIAYELAPGESAETSCNLGIYLNEEELEPGQYRVIKGELTADFTIDEATKD